MSHDKLTRVRDIVSNDRDSSIRLPSQNTKVRTPLPTQSIAYRNLQDRITKLENRLDDLSEVVKRTVLDIRALISELENPFNILKAVLETDGEMVRKSHEEESRENYRKESKSKPNTSPSQEVFRLEREFPRDKTFTIETRTDYRRENLKDAHSSLKVLLVSVFLLYKFGLEGAIKALGMYIREGWISSEVASTLERVTRNLATQLSVTNTIESSDPSTKALDHMIVLSLLDLLERDSSEGIILAMTLAMKEILKDYSILVRKLRGVVE